MLKFFDDWLSDMIYWSILTDPFEEEEQEDINEETDDSD